MPPSRKTAPARVAPVRTAPADDPTARLSRLEAEVARLTQQVALLDAALRARDPILQRHGANDSSLYARTARIDAQEHLAPDSGFHALVYATDGTAIRWTGPGLRSCISLYVSRAKPVSVTLGVHDFNGLDPASIRIAVDGEGLPLRRSAQGVWIAGPFAAHDRATPTEIALLVPTTTATPDAHGAPRKVGIALTHLEVGPA